MAKQTAQTGAIATQQHGQLDKPKQERFSNFLAKPTTQAWIASVISDPKEASKFVSSIVSATTTNVQLQSCERNSIISSGLLANALGLSLSPQLGLCYMVPFKNKAQYKDGVMVKPESYTATFVLGYKGYIQLAIRSGYYKNINVISIKEGELIKYDPLTEELEVNLVQDERERAKLPTIGYYASFKLMNGFTKSIYWSKEKMLVHADKYSAAFSAEAFDKLQVGKIPEKDLWKYSSFWYKDFDGMAYKTMLRQLISKWGIMSIDMQKAEEEEVKQEQARVQSMGGIVEPTYPLDENPTEEDYAEAAQALNADSNGVVFNE